ncbi:MAG: hypothetical protein IJ723_02680 [Ruminococcus sp.]|nr:hypothetical protein [Ruminococcus sp.]
MFDRIKRLPPLTVITAELLVISLGAFIAGFAIGRNRMDKGKPETVPQIKAELVNSEDFAASALTGSGSIDRVRAVKITDGEGYVRFRVELLDSDGETLSQKLRQKEEDIEVFKSYLTDQDMPSYEAFNDAYHQMLNEQRRLQLKASAALAAFCKADGSDLLESGDMIRLDDPDGCSCTLICRKKLSAGDTAELYSRIAVPSDDAVDTGYEAYIKNEDNSYRTEQLDAGVSELLGSGFGIHVTAEVIPSDGSDTAFTAFLLADEAGDEDI